MSDEPEPARPTLGSDHSAAREATEAAVRVVKQLQVGLDDHDADAHNRHLAPFPTTPAPSGPHAEAGAASASETVPSG
jgi:hypothetical protein